MTTEALGEIAKANVKALSPDDFLGKRDRVRWGVHEILSYTETPERRAALEGILDGLLKNGFLARDPTFEEELLIYHYQALEGSESPSARPIAIHVLKTLRGALAPLAVYVLAKQKLTPEGAEAIARALARSDVSAEQKEEILKNAQPLALSTPEWASALKSAFADSNNGSDLQLAALNELAAYAKRTGKLDLQVSKRVIELMESSRSA